MKFIKQGLFLLVFLLTVSIPITTYAAGEGNIDHGGGMLGELIFGAATMRGCV